MKKLQAVLVAYAIFAVSAGPVLGGTLTITTNMDLYWGPGSLQVQFWANGFNDIIGIEVIPVFTRYGVDVSSAFTMATDPTNVIFQGYNVKHNSALWPNVTGFTAGSMVGFIGLDPVGVDPATDTLMLTITYNYGDLGPATQWSHMVSLAHESTGLVNSIGKVEGVQVINAYFPTAFFPEPSTLALLACGLAGLLAYGRRSLHH